MDGSVKALTVASNKLVELALHGTLGEVAIKTTAQSLA